MMAESTTHDEIPSHDPEEKIDFHYEGGGFPWLLRLLWIAFAIFFVVYMVKWYVPDLMNYLDHGIDILQ
jgi:hypothetical protein